MTKPLFLEQLDRFSQNFAIDLAAQFPGRSIPEKTRAIAVSETVTFNELI
jgi:hypothetical protein